MWLKMSLIRPDRATSFHSVMLPVLTDALDRRRSSGAWVSPRESRGMPIRTPTDADIRSLFDEVSQQWLERFLRHRIGDPRIIRLIQKWLKAGVLEDGVVTVSDKGTGQGSVASPLLANIYLHYVFDLWATRWRRREAAGNMIIVRFADDSAPRRRREEVPM
jgi:retron-type reverse transcriptase